MTTNLQVSVDDALAAAARARAAETHRSLAGYIKDLIERDLASVDERRRMAVLLAEIAEDDSPALDREVVAAALADVRRDMGTT